MALFDAGKIESARLALNWAAYDRLDRKYRDIFSVAHLSQTSDQTSMICLKCVDDIFIIEGTHNFGLRMFHQTFPIPNFWEHPKRSYQDRELRVSPSACPLFLPHDHSAQWITKFFRYLRMQFHVEWNDVRLNKTPNISSITEARAQRQISVRTASPNSRPHAKSQNANATRLIIENYSKHLMTYFASGNNMFAVDQRINFLEALYTAGKIINAIIIESTFDRTILVMNCVNGVTIVDAVHYENLRILRDYNQFWNSLNAAIGEPALQVRLIKKADYPVKIPHAPLEICLSRLIHELANTWEVGWIINL